jgi:hypothetical protein
MNPFTTTIRTGDIETSKRLHKLHKAGTTFIDIGAFSYTRMSQQPLSLLP